MRKFVQHHWLWFIVILVGFGIYDVIICTNMEGSMYHDYPIEWMIFRAAATTSILFSIYATTKFLQLFRIPEMGRDLLVVVSAIIIHLHFAGPVWNDLLWVHSKIEFDTSYRAFALLVMSYTIYRVLFSMILLISRRFR